MPGDRAVTKIVKRRRMVGQAITAIFRIYDVLFRLSAIPIEVISSDDAVVAFERLERGKIRGLRVKMGAEGRWDFVFCGTDYPWNA